MDVSCAFATSPDTPVHVAIAESLGYRRAWLYDSPALYPDVWMTLARCAERTVHIGLGPAALIPNLRHVLTNAVAIASLEHLAPGRTAAVVGSGFTGRLVLGQRPLPWRQVASYVRALRSLLRGEDASWEGSVIAMVHPDGFLPARPVEVPVLIAAAGPKGMAVARELGDGVFTSGRGVAGFAWNAVLAFGTVLVPGEDVGSDRVMAAAGHGAAVALHAMYERGETGRAAVRGMPGGAGWLAQIDAVPAERRHLVLHEAHLVAVSDRDRAALTPDLVGAMTLTGEAAAVRARLHELAAQGATEIAYQPAGPDIPRELEAFIRAAT